MRSFKKKYLAGVARGENVTSIPSKKTGRPLTLGKIDGDVQSYTKSLRAAGTPISVPVVIAAAEGIVQARDRTLLADHGGSILPNRSWAVSLMRRMGYARRKATTQAKHQVSQDQYKKLQLTYLKHISGMAKAHNVPPELIINWDQTPINVCPTTNWTMAQVGSKRVEVAALNDKRQVTCTLGITMSGEFLPPQILYQGKTERCHPSYSFPDRYDIWHAPHHWANGSTVVRYINSVVIPYVQKVKKEKSLPADQHALVIYDVFKGHCVDIVDTVLERRTN